MQIHCCAPHMGDSLFEYLFEIKEMEIYVLLLMHETLPLTSVTFFMFSLSLENSHTTAIAISYLVLFET